MCPACRQCQAKGRRVASISDGVSDLCGCPRSHELPDPHRLGCVRGRPRAEGWKAASGFNGLPELSCAHAAMSFLIPIGVVVYAAIGGLKATFTTSYMHTVIIFVLCLIFMFKVFVPGDFLGGIDDVSTSGGPPSTSFAFHVSRHACRISVPEYLLVPESVFLPIGSVKSILNCAKLLKPIEV